MGNHHVKEKRRPKARARRPRKRTCANKKCGRKYQAGRWNQRYCQDPECMREVDRWLAARRQGKRREAGTAKAQHAQAEKARRQQAKSVPKDVQKPELTPARGHAAKFLAHPFCDRPGCYEPRMTSLRNPARFCCAACRQVVRNVLDRERKWRSRGTLDGQTKRAYEYQASCRRQRSGAADVPSRAPPE